MYVQLEKESILNRHSWQQIYSYIPIVWSGIMSSD